MAFGRTAALIVAALIVAAVVVFGLYLLLRPETLSSGSTGACIVSPGYKCSGTVYTAATGNLSASIGQSTGSGWAAASFLFVPEGTAYTNGVPDISWNSSTAVTGGLASGGVDQVSLRVSGPVGIGTSVSGTIWARYQLNAGGTVYYAEVAAVKATAV